MAWKPDYALLADLRKDMRITDAGDVADDWRLSLAITASSRAIDRACGRQFGVLSSAAPRYYVPYWDPERARYVVDIDDLMTTSGLVVESDTSGDSTYATAITGYVLEELNAVADGKPWTRMVLPAGAGSSKLRITAKWGWTAVPSGINLACLLQSLRLVKRRDAPFGVTGSAEMGNLTRLLAKLDPDVEAMCADYRRWWGAV